MENEKEKTVISDRKLIIKSIIHFLMMVVLVFCSAGTLRYWQGWAFVSYYVVISVLALKKLKANKSLLMERIKPGPGVKWWDKIIFYIYVPLTMISIVFSSMDGGRFHFSPAIPIGIYIIVYAIMVCSYSFIMWAMFTNNFFSSRVRIQSDRGQYVVQEGPYKFVRHPGYFGVLFWQPSTSISLGSVWGLIPAVLAVVTIIVRTYLEDRMLQKELPGYSEYAKKVRYRLIPGIW